MNLTETTDISKLRLRGDKFKLVALKDDNPEAKNQFDRFVVVYQDTETMELNFTKVNLEGKQSHKGSSEYDVVLIEEHEEEVFIERLKGKLNLSVHVVPDIGRKKIIVSMWYKDKEIMRGEDYF